jgi:hypothetical protein
MDRNLLHSARVQYQAKETTSRSNSSFIVISRNAHPNVDYPHSASKILRAIVNLFPGSYEELHPFPNLHVRSFETVFRFPDPELRARLPLRQSSRFLFSTLTRQA